MLLAGPTPFHDVVAEGVVAVFNKIDDSLFFLLADALLGDQCGSNLLDLSAELSVNLFVNVSAELGFTLHSRNYTLTSRSNVSTSF